MGDVGPPVSPYVRAEATATETAYLLNPRLLRPHGDATAGNRRAEFCRCGGGRRGAPPRRNPGPGPRGSLAGQGAAADAGVTVQAYALPRLHCLVPNARRPLLANRTFRRALAYGIDRQAVLEQLLRGDTLPGCVPLHGPMPVGASAQDPLDYASDPEVEPWPYDPRLALALAEGGRRELAAGGRVRRHAALPPGEGRRLAWSLCLLSGR